MRRFLLAFCLVSAVYSQAMTQPAVKRIFKYCAAADLATVTKNLNAAKNVAACNTACGTFASGKNLIAAGAKTTAKDPLATPDGAKTACGKFCAHRGSVKKYIDFMFGKLGTKYFTANKAAEMKSLFWKIDKAQNNNFNVTATKFLPQALQMVNKGQQPTLVAATQTLNQDFPKQFPADAQNLFTYVY